MKSIGPSRFAVLLLAIAAGLALDGMRLVDGLEPAPRQSLFLRDLQELAAFGPRDYERPIVLVTSSIQNHALAYHFVPNPTKKRFALPEEIAPVLMDSMPELMAELVEFRERMKRIGMAYTGDPLAALEGAPGYVVAFELAPEVMAEVHGNPGLELVYRSADGLSRWYQTR